MDLRPLSSSPQFQVSSFWRIYLMRLTKICKRCLTISKTPTRQTSAFHTFRSFTFGLHLKFRWIVAKIFNKCFNRFSPFWASSNVKHGWHVWWRLDPDWSRAGLDGECWILFPLLDDCDCGATYVVRPRTPCINTGLYLYWNINLEIRKDLQS